MTAQVPVGKNAKKTHERIFDTKPLQRVFDWVPFSPESSPIYSPSAVHLKKYKLRINTGKKGDTGEYIKEIYKGSVSLRLMVEIHNNQVVELYAQDLDLSCLSFFFIYQTVSQAVRLSQC